MKREAALHDFIVPLLETDRKPRPSLLLRLITLIVIAAIGFGVALFVWEVAKMEIAHPRPPQAKLPNTKTGRAAAGRTWARVEPRLAQRLRQKNLELGAVWSTRTGRICGLVNGLGGFGGLVGMVQFYTDGDGFTFSVDPPSDFFMTWRQCKADRWQVLHAGSQDRGLCATRLGRPRCIVVGQQLVMR